MQPKGVKAAIISTPYAEPEKGACTLRVNFFKDALEKQGFKVFVLAPARDAVPQVPGVIRYSSKVGMVLSAISIASRFPGNLLVVGVSPPLFQNVFSLAAARLCGARFVLDAKDDGQYYQTDYSGFFGSAKRKAYLAARKLVYTSADALLFLSNSDIHEATASYSIPKSKVHLVMNGSDTGKIFPDQIARQKVRKRFGINGGCAVVIYAGSLGDEDVSGFMAECSSTIKNAGAKILLAVTHDSSPSGAAEIESLRNFVKARGLEKDAFIVENLEYSKLKDYFSAADIGVLPWPDRLVTSIPVKIFDYASAGLAVAAKSPLNSEASSLILRHNLGFVSGNWGVFREKLSSLMKDKRGLEKIKLHNRREAEMHFDRDRQAKSLLSAILK